MTDLHRPPHAPAPRPRGPLAHSLCLGLSACLLLTSAAPAWAQFRRADAPSVSPRIPGARNMSTDLKLAGMQTTSDFIVAVVNQELITHTEVDKRVARIQDAARASGQTVPAPDELRRQVLDAMIDEKAQVSFAKSINLEVSDAEIDGAVESIASQNQLSLGELKQKMAADGLDYQRYRNSLREQLVLQRLREREVTPRIQISEADIDTFLRDDPAAQNEVALNVAHILVAVPEKASPSQLQALQAKAQELQARAARGENFSQLAKTSSDDRNTRNEGGGFGLRNASRLPELFVSAVQGLKVGEVSPVVRSNAGFHIVKLIERENSAQATYTQQRARHILLRTTPQAPVADLVKRMADIRKEITGGQSSFAQMARQYSEDGSASRGGDLGWASPGQFVPEFEKALGALQPGQVSEPVISRFGVHLIQLIERREVQLTEQQKREAARSVLRERRFEAAYEEWARELRAAAFVDVRDAP